jgi:hypothetical protein
MPRLSALGALPFAAVLAAAALLPAAASAAPSPAGLHRQATCAAAPPLIHSDTPQLQPENTVWDPTRSRVLVGSIRQGTVSVVNPDHTTTPLVTDSRLIGTGGVRVDPARGRLLATFDDTYDGPGALLSVRSTPQTAGHYAGLGIFDLATGRTIKLINLAGQPGLHLANDLALDPAGNAYVSDSFNGTVYKVDTAGHASVFLNAPALTAPVVDGAPSVGPNGIVYHDGYLVLVRYDTGELFKIPLRAPQSFTKVALSEPVVGADGIALRPDGDLIAVTNTIKSTGIEGVIVVRSGDNWRTAHRIDTTPWPDHAPTMVALTPCGDYVLSSGLDVLFHSGGKSTVDGFNLRRFDG